MRCIRNNDPGFTLVEMLVVTAIVAVVAMALFANISNGVKLWKKVNQELVHQDLNIFLDKFSTDIKNSLRFKGLGFSGDKSHFRIPTIVNSSRLGVRSIGVAAYIYSESGHVLVRQQEDIPRVYSGEEAPAADAITNIRSLEFQYYYFDKVKKQYVWKEEASGEDLPLAIQMEFELEDSYKVSLAVNIPVSN